MAQVKVVALGAMVCFGESYGPGVEFEMSSKDAEVHKAAGLVFIGTKADFDKAKAAETSKAK